MQTLKNSALGVIITTLAMFIIIYLALSTTTWVSLAIIAVAVVILLFMEKKNWINPIFDMFIKHKKTAIIAVILCALVLPLLLSGHKYFLRIAVMACIYGILALGLNFQMGSTDMVNFAPAAFFGVGAYTSAVFVAKLGMSPWLGLIFAIITSVILGLIVGMPTLRTQGYYLSLVTMALQLIFSMVLVNIPYLGGPDGIKGIKSFTIFGFDLGKNHAIGSLKLPYQLNYLYLAIIALVILSYIAHRVYISRTGLALNTIAQDEVAANCFGIKVTRQKLFAFCIGGMFCGIAGSIYAHYTAFVGPDDFDFTKSLMIICMLILGGMDNPTGVIVGAFILTTVNEKLRDFAEYQMLLYGLILMIVLIVRPSGLIPKRIRDYCANFKIKVLKRVDDDGDDKSKESAPVID